MSADLEVHGRTAPRGAVLLTLEGALTAATSTVLESEVRRWSDRGRSSLWVRLDGLRELTPTGVTALVALMRVAQDHGGEVRVETPRRELLDVFERCRVLDVLPLVDELEEGAP